MTPGTASLSLLYELAGPFQSGAPTEWAWQAAERWFGIPLDGVLAGEDWTSVNLTLSGLNEYPTGPDEAQPLSPDSPWFCVEILRDPRTADRVHGEHGIELWYAPTPSLWAATRHPSWHPDALLGLECLGQAGVDATRLLASPQVQRIRTAIAERQPVLVQITSTWLPDDILLNAAEP